MEYSKKIISGVLFVFICIQLAVTAYLFVDLFRQVSEKKKTELRLVDEEIKTHVSELKKELEKVETGINELSGRISIGKINRSEVYKVLLKMLQRNPALGGGGISYNGSNSEKSKTVIVTKKGRLRQSHVQESREDFSLNWRNTILENGPAWVGPLLEKGYAEERQLVRFGSPFYRLDTQSQVRKPAGVVFVDIPLAYIAYLLKVNNALADSYPMLISGNGTFLYHPDHDRVGRDTIFDLSKTRGKKELRRIAKLALQGEKGQEVFFDDFLKTEFEIFHQPLGSGGWSYFLLRETKKTQLILQQLRRPFIVGMLSVTGIGLLIVLFIMNNYLDRSVTVLWLSTIAISFLLFTGIGIFWFFASQNLQNESVEDERVVMDPGSMQKFFALFERKLEAGNIRLNYTTVPAGIYIQTIEPVSASNIAVNGYLWQRYENKSEADIKELSGFLFPDAVDLAMEDAQVVVQDDSTVALWNFKVTLNQDFNYSRYPFDHRTIDIRLWHKRMDKAIILVPDFEYYENMNPVLLPGIDPELGDPGWIFKSSFFKYRIINYEAHFGLDSRKKQREFPELIFSISEHRVFFDPFMENMLPVFVILSILFSMMMLATTDQERAGELGFEAMTMITTCSALFFAILLAQIKLRNDLSTPGVIYLEYFYYVTYFLILMVSINTYAFTAKGDGLFLQLVRYKNNLAVKLIFWPFFWGLSLFFTFYVFY